MIEINKKYSDFQAIALEYSKKYQKLMDKNTIAQEIIDIYKRNKS